MEYIYSRISTGRQDHANQLVRLKVLYPNAIVFEETISSTKRRPVLDKLAASLQAGDRLIVAALDRLGRKTSEILALIEDLERRQVILISVREGVDYSTVTGRLVTQVLAACAEMERGLISMRTRDALAAKRLQGIVGGRRPTYSAEVVTQVKRLRAGGMSCRGVAKALGLSASRVSQLTKGVA